MSDKFKEMFGEITGQGAQADVYTDGKYAVKLYREDYPKRNVFSEAYVMMGLETIGFPSPRVHEVLLVDGRYALRMDIAKGEVMSKDVSDPAMFEQKMNDLIALQLKIQQLPVSDGIPHVKARFRADIMQNPAIKQELKDKLIAVLDKLPDGNAICHCDFHADNVFFDGTDYTIIDLLQISAGDPAADAACSYMAYSFIDRDIADYYLDKYCAASNIPAERVKQWVPVYAGTLIGQLPDNLMPVVEEYLKEL